MKNLAVSIWVLCMLYLIFAFVDVHPAIFLAIGSTAFLLFALFSEKFSSCIESFGKIWNFILAELWHKDFNLVFKTEAETRQERTDFAQKDHFYDVESDVIDLRAELGAEAATRFNYKVEVKINDDSLVLAEIDTDSHISLISEDYFKKIMKLGDIEYLHEQPPSFHGLGSSVKSKYSPVILNVQIGKTTITIN